MAFMGSAMLHQPTGGLHRAVFKLHNTFYKYLDECFNSAIGADDSTEGFRRNKELRDKGNISYQQLKRMKNWFSN